MSTEHYKQMLGEAMQKVKRVEALVARASKAESAAFHKQHSYNNSLRVSAKAKNYLNKAYQSLNGVKQEIRKSMKKSSGGKRSTLRKRNHKHCTHRKRHH